MGPVFISYARQDRDRVLSIADELTAARVPVWIDKYGIHGGERWAAEIVAAIEASSVVALMCSDAAMRSWAVKQEIQLAGESQKVLLPLLLEKTSFPAQIKFFLAGWQWIEILDWPAGTWLPQVLQALESINGLVADVKKAAPAALTAKQSSSHNQLVWNFEGLKAIASFTDQIWPVQAKRAAGGPTTRGVRGLGAPQPAVRHRFQLGEKMQIIVEASRRSHLLLLDEGPEKLTYCLCPSHFAPRTELAEGKNVFPQAASQYDSFVLTGSPGRETLIAILSEEPLRLDWAGRDPQRPARILSQNDLQDLMMQLRAIQPNQWIALSTCFDVLPAADAAS